MPNRQAPSKAVQSRLVLVGLMAVTLFLVLVMTVQPFDVRALQGNSPPPTDTPFPTDTPIPTDTPVPIPTDTPEPLPTDTPIPADTATFTPIPVVTSTPIPPGTPLPPLESPTPTSTNTPLPGITPDIPTQTPPPLPAITPTDAPPPAQGPFTTTLPLTATEGMTKIIIPVDQQPANTDTLVLLIDTLVLYSAYFFLGCGFIVFVILVVGLILLDRRAKALQNEQALQEQPPQPPGA